MLDRHWIREHAEELKAAMQARGAKVDVDAYLALDRRRRELLQAAEERKHFKKKVSEEIGALKKAGQEAGGRREEMRRLGDDIAAMEKELADTEARMAEVELTIPNLPDASVPAGRSSEDNAEIRRWGAPPAFSSTPKPHWDIGEALDILDFKRAAKIAGARFTVLKGQGALLERALIQFMLDLHTREHGYTEVLPPFIVNRDSLTGTGQLPKFEEDLFRLQGTEWFLIPTAEVPVTNLHRDEILPAEQLPVRYVSYTPCFRSEAGSYGKDTRGYIRQHQFNKVELVQITRPEDSTAALERLTGHAEEVLRRLGLHYRVMALCAGDMGFASAKTYDLEVWFPSENGFKEISSCSNFKDFQARRAAMRYRPEAGAKPQFVHTLNGSGLAVGRTLAAILENFQNADGTVAVPEALKPYMHGTSLIKP